MQPLLFLGHGSPMIAIENNELTQSLRELGQSLEKPNAVLCISADWQQMESLFKGLRPPSRFMIFMVSRMNCSNSNMKHLGISTCTANH